jgi:hypothetical protein
MFKDCLVKDLTTNEVLVKQIDEAFVDEILEKGLILDLFQEGRFTKASEKDLKEYKNTSLNTVKASVIQQIKTQAKLIIEQEYPLYKQNNILMTEAKTSQVFKDMVAFISKVRNKTAQLEKLVQQGASIEEIEKIQVVFE